MKEYTFKAFISYRHTEFDKRVAVKLHRMLETYKFPKELSGLKEDWRVFRDVEELSAGSDLSEKIKRALENSEYLIVICSSETRRSRWCIEEIEYFKKLHNNSTGNIIPLLIEGGPENFPEELRHTVEVYTDSAGRMWQREMDVEPLAANIAGESQKESMKKLKSEFLRIAAAISNCDFDALYDRNRRRKFKRMIVVATAVFVLISSFAVYSGATALKINGQNIQLNEQNAELRLANAEISTKTTETMFNDNDRIGALKTALSVRPYANDPNELLPSTQRFLTKATYTYMPQPTLKLDRMLSADTKIEEVVLSPDGSRLMAWDSGQPFALYVWDTASGKRLCTVREYSLRYARFIDNDTVIIDAYDSINKLDVTTGEETVLLDISNSGSMLSDDRSVIEVNTSDRLMFIDVSDGRIIWDTTLPPIDGEPGYFSLYDGGICDFYGGSKFIAAISKDPTFQVDARLFEFDIEDKTYTAMPAVPERLCDVAYLGEDSYICMTDTTGYFYPSADVEFCRGVRLFTRGEEVASQDLVFSGNGEPVPGLEISDGKGGLNGVVKYPQPYLDGHVISYGGWQFPVAVMTLNDECVIVDGASGQVIMSGSVGSNIVKVWGDGNVIRFICADGSVRDIDPVEGTAYVSESIASTEIGADCAGDYFASVCAKCDIAVYTFKNDAKNSKKISEPGFKAMDYIYSMDNTLVGTSMMDTDTGDTWLFVYDADTLKQKAKIHLRDVQYIPYYCLCGGYLVYCMDGEICYYNIDDGEEGVLSGVDGEDVIDISSSVDGDALIISKYDELIRIDGDGTHRNSLNVNAYNNVSLTSDDGTKFVYIDKIDYDNSWDSVYKVYILDLVTGEKYQIYETGERIYETDTFRLEQTIQNPKKLFSMDDGMHRLALSVLNKVVIFDTETMEEVNTFTTEFKVVMTAFIPDSDCILVYGQNSKLYKYDFKTGEKLGEISTRDVGEEPDFIRMDLEKNQAVISWLNLYDTDKHYPLWFIDLETMECDMQFDLNSVSEILPEREEISIGTADGIYVYPYYSSEQLVARAEAEINGE